jgi:hypothetical protein
MAGWNFFNHAIGKTYPAPPAPYTVTATAYGHPTLPYGKRIQPAGTYVVYPLRHGRGYGFIFRRLT